MEKVDYYTGQPEPMRVDPDDHSDQFALDARMLYGNQQPTQQHQQLMYWQNPYQQQQQQIYGNGWNPSFNPVQLVQPTVGYPQYGAPMNIPQYNGGQLPRGANPIFYNGMLNPNNPYQYGNPAFQQAPMTSPVGSYNPYTGQVMYYNNTPQDKVVSVPGFNPYGDKKRVIFPADLEEQCEKLDIDMMMDTKAEMEKWKQSYQGTFNFNQGAYYNYANYYGNPYMAGGYINYATMNKYTAKARGIIEQAEARYTNLLKGLSASVHAYLKDGVTQDDIDRLYDGYTYTIPAATIIEDQKAEWLGSLKPYSNAEMYQRADAQVTAMYRALAPSHDLNGFLTDCGVLILAEQIEAQYHKNKDTTRYYQQDVYERFLSKYAYENRIKKEGSRQNTSGLVNSQMEEMKRRELEEREKVEKHQQEVLEQVKRGDTSGLPTTREEAARFLYGEKAAEFVKRTQNNGFTVLGPHDQNGTPVFVNGVLSDEEEAQYNMRRNAFIDSIYHKESYAEQDEKIGVSHHGSS